MSLALHTAPVHPADSAPVPLPPHAAPGAGLANLDFLRAVAVLFVLLDHTVNGLLYGGDGGGNTLGWMGRLGVLFFFVHTCCVLMMSLERHTQRHPLTSFYLRRAFRIYPLSIVAVLAAFLSSSTASLHGWERAANLLLVQNLVFARNAFGSMWSLPLEVQMYVSLPFLYLLLKRTRQPVWLLLVYAVSIPLAWLQPGHVARATVLQYVPDFLPGVLAYILFRRVTPRAAAWGFPVFLAGLSAAFLLHPGWGAPAWAACLLLGAAMPLFRELSFPALNTASAALARYSYGIYLSHSILLLWFRPTGRTLVPYLVLVAVCAVAGYHLVELPMMRLGKRWTTWT